ncbi:MAG TPA: serine--tRNA ligase, partial [Ktedonobacterales bacterium]|nr:serine--tRNA ligase [Ktedonobacterales bacterium]
PDRVRVGLLRRNVGPETLAALDGWLALDAERRALASEHDQLPGQGGDESARKELRARLAALEDEQRALLAHIPNLPRDDVPDGYDASANVELRRWGTPPVFDFAPKRHDELATALGILDLPRATKLAGPRFPLLVGDGARLLRALGTLMLDLHRERGYVEIAPPHLLRTAILEGTGHLPRYADDLYQLPADGLALSPTAETQLVALHADETLSEPALPLAYTACTPAFRREAGSAGAKGRGLIRQHQFDKVELVRVATPETADAAFATLLADAEESLRRLGLAYRVVALCAGELPFAAERTVDLEVWMPGEGRYVEISSVSDCGTFQARGLRLRYRPAGGGRARYPHTLNGSALALGRTLAALLENGQRRDGSVELPPALHRYMGTDTLQHRARPD